MAPFYTGKGDAGDTGFLGEGRISKTSERIEAVGTVDEATAAVGIARAMAKDEQTKSILLQVQKQLYWLMAELSASPDVAETFDKIGDADVGWLETQIKLLENDVMMPREFIIPGETASSGALSLARTIVRRAERRTIALLEAGGINKQILLTYLNRLSSLIFTLEVFESSIEGGGIRSVKEV